MDSKQRAYLIEFISKNYGEMFHLDRIQKNALSEELSKKDEKAILHEVNNIWEYYSSLKHAALSGLQKIIQLQEQSESEIETNTMSQLIF
jgi:hypothetical protein